MSKEHLLSNILKTTFIIGTVSFISQLAFSGKTRDKIIGRSGNRSEVSGAEPPDGVALHAAHLNHDRSLPSYDTAENGLAMLPIEHLIQHVVHRGQAEVIGLSEEDNESAIALLASVIGKQK